MRANLALVADTSLSALRGTRELDRVITKRSGPKMIVSDNVLCREAAFEFGQQVSSRRQGVDVGSTPMQNGFIESFKALEG